MIPLFPYQTEAANKVFTHWKNGKKRVLLQMPTGTGKTTVYSYVNQIALKVMQRDQLFEGKVLVVAHKQELIFQGSERLNRFGIETGIIMGEIPTDPDKAVQVASIQTLSRRTFPENVEFVIIDEAHHATAETYLELFRQYPDAYFLGVTATPIRLDGSGFEFLDKAKTVRMFDELVTTHQISWFIENGYLAKPIQKKPNMSSQFLSDLGQMRTKGGDYDPNALYEYFKKYIGNLVKDYEHFAKGKKFIVFAANIKHSQEIAAEYQKAGYKAFHIDGKTPDDHRKWVLEEFGKANGEVEIICNVNLVGEGVDIPACDGVQLARVTKSLALYLQWCGRALRTAEGKECAWILDNGGNYYLHGRADEEREWTLQGIEKRKKGKAERKSDYPVRTQTPNEVAMQMEDAERRPKPEAPKTPAWVIEFRELLAKVLSNNQKPLHAYFTFRDKGKITSRGQLEYIKRIYWDNDLYPTNKKNSKNVDGANFFWGIETKRLFEGQGREG